MSKPVYRPDIDGLRALAVLPVVWFHAGLPGLPGGFTGVDTFFVISGYLITLIIHREVAEGQFSFVRFYERRVRRIAPALLLVVAATLLVGTVLLLPYELEKLGDSAVASIAMVPNIYFWSEAGYFALGVKTTPLLHTWSLGIEEQFYVFFPIVLIVAHRLKIVKSVVLAIAVISFALCLIGTAIAPSASFYLLPTRAWELMLGALLAIGVVHVPARLRPASALVGLTMVVGAAMFVTNSGFPGWLAAIPAVGALLIIAAGPDTLVSRAIANRPFIAIGKISYSLYLWHWPVFAYLRHFRADPTLPAAWAIGGIVLSIALAWATYLWIEQPARSKSVPYRRVALIAATFAFVIVGIGVTISTFQGLPGRLEKHVLALADRRNDLATLAHACVNTPLDKIDTACHIGPAGTPNLLVWGDSHAAAAAEGVAQGLERPGAVASMNSCAPTMGWINPDMPGRDGEICRERNKAVLDRVSNDPALKTVVLVAYWPSHARNGGKEMWSAVQAAVDYLRRRGKTVAILKGTPEPGMDVPWAAAINDRFDRKTPQWDCPAPRHRLHGVEVVDLSTRYCSDPHPIDLFTDGNHPSKTAGVRIIAPAFRSLNIAGVL